MGDVEKLYNLEEEIEITENELTELNHRKEVADKEEEISKMQELKEREKRTENKVKKLKKEIGKNDLSDLIIDRTKSNEEVSGKIDTLAKEFHGLEEEKKELNLRRKGMAK